jgi:hypothetical protein
MENGQYSWRHLSWRARAMESEADFIKTLYLLFTYCYDISVILSEANHLRALHFHAPPNPFSVSRHKRPGMDRRSGCLPFLPLVVMAKLFAFLWQGTRNAITILCCDLSGI